MGAGGRHAPAAFIPVKDLVPTVQEAGWAPGTVWTGVEKFHPQQVSIPGSSSLKSVTIPTELLPAHENNFSNCVITLITEIFCLTVQYVSEMSYNSIYICHKQAMHYDTTPSSDSTAL